MKRRSRISAVALSALVMTGTMAVGLAGQASANQNDSSTFSMFFNFGDGKGFDPDLFSWEAYLDSEGIYEGLVIPSPNAKPIPGIATSWKISPDGRTYTFYLNKHAKFSNGDPVTAQDFVFSMQRAVNPNTAVTEGGTPAVITNLPILNAQQIRQGAPGVTINSLGVKAINNYTLQIQLAYKDPHFLRDLTLPSSAWVVPLDPAVVNKMAPQDWSNPAKIVSNGPYMLQSYTVRTSATLVSNPHYYGKVNFNTINLYYNSTAANDTSLPSFESGQMDESMLLPQDLAAVRGNPSLKADLHIYPTSAQYTLAVTPSANTALQNPMVREAFSLAINRNIITNDVLQGAGAPAYNFFLPTWLNPWVNKYAISYNPQKARQLLAKAGYPGGKGFPTVLIIVGTTTDPVATAIQQMWEQNLGVKVQFDGLEWGQYVNALTTQLPPSEVGFMNVATNANYADLMLPQSLATFTQMYSNLVNGLLPSLAFQSWAAINNNSQLSPVEKQAKELAIYQKYLPKYVINNIQLGIKAFQTGSQSLLEKYYGQQIQQSFQIGVYTPSEPILLYPALKGYQPDQMLLIDPPYWLNNISK